MSSALLPIRARTLAQQQRRSSSSYRRAVSRGMKRRDSRRDRVCEPSEVATRILPGRGQLADRKSQRRLTKPLKVRRLMVSRSSPSSSPFWAPWSR